jgi:hypothetical protein
VSVWDANNGERAGTCIRFLNPFKTAANSVRAYLNSSGMHISALSVSISPGRNFNLYAGAEPNIKTFKSVVTAEFPSRKTCRLPAHWNISRKTS